MEQKPVYIVPGAEKHIAVSAVAALFAGLRAEQRLSLRDFAELLGVSHMAIQKFETGEIQPGAETLVRWLHDEREWVSRLAEDVMVARYRESLQAISRVRVSA